MIQNVELERATQVIADCIRERRAYLFDQGTDTYELLNDLTTILFTLTACITPEVLSKHP